MKSKLFAKSAAVDRGFGASPKDREEIADLVDKLSAITSEQQPTRGLIASDINIYDTDSSVTKECPLEGSWQMVYTSAFDVLSLAASPFTLLQGIYQVISRNGASVNVIDIAPRIQVIIPAQFQKSIGTTLRVSVKTTAKARSDKRVGLAFNSLTLGAQKVFDFDVKNIPKFGLNFPRSQMGSSSTATNQDPGFFDVLYLDDDCLIIQQNAPGRLLGLGLLLHIFILE